MNHKIVLIAHNIRSTHNVGSLLRTADGLGVNKVFLTGYTPYPKGENDLRLPYLAEKINNQIAKTALGAEKYIGWEHVEDIQNLIKDLKKSGYEIIALEQTKQSIDLATFHAPSKIALVVGREVEGIELDILELVDKIIFIPMAGKKESFNVVQAAAMALYKIRFLN